MRREMLAFFLFPLFFHLILSQDVFSWVEQQELIASDGFANEYFGGSVSIYGNYALVGAHSKKVGSNTNQGVAYSFLLNGNSWVQTQELTSSDGAANDNFGSSVSISGNYAIIGAPYKTIGSNQAQGATYIFYFDGSSWIQQQELISSDGAANDFFGHSISISGNYAIIGAPFKTIGNNTQQGAAYIFYFDGSSWIQQQELIASDGFAIEYFGNSVSIYGSYSIVGTHWAKLSGTPNQGAAYFFYFNGNSWIQQLLISNDGALSDFFSWSVSIYGNYAMFGAPFKTIGNNPLQGSVYVFYFNGNSWVQQQELVFTDGAAGDRFGQSVSIYGNYAIISAPYKAVEGTTDEGAAYIFYFDGTSWIQQQEIISSDGTLRDYFGNAVSIYAPYAIVGSSFNTIGDNVEQGAAYIFYYQDVSQPRNFALIGGVIFGISASVVICFIGIVLIVKYRKRRRIEKTGIELSYLIVKDSSNQDDAQHNDESKQNELEEQKRENINPSTT